jgi:hypothetical protein
MPPRANKLIKMLAIGVGSLIAKKKPVFGA